MDYTIDAKGQKLGRLASKIALLLQGKDNPGYEPRLPGANQVRVKNVSGIEISGRKTEQKIYYRHTGYMGHLKKLTYRQLFERSPKKVLEKAVYNMLPKNRLRQERMTRLIVND